MQPLRDDDFLLHESRLHVPGWGVAGLHLERILKGGSDRSYYRVSAHGPHDGPDSAILMVYTDQRPDNLSFFAATEVLALAGARVPELYHHDELRKLAWLEDLGRRDLHDWHAEEAMRLPLYKSALEQVAKVHALTWEEIPQTLRAQMQPPFDEALYAWEQGYFFKEFAARFSAAGEDRLALIQAQEEFAELRRTLAALPRSPVHRDFQSQNLMIREGHAWMIDYQGLRPGRPEYDLASLLYDPYVSLSTDERAELRDYYFGLRAGSDCHARLLAMCACQRLMQALGAYGKLGIGDGKPAFLRHIRPAVSNLKAVLAESGLLPSLEEVLVLREEAMQAVPP
jgi:N-acetylmuramate 1-kinase